MTRPVRTAQNVSKMCHVCGIENTSGLQARFFETDGDEVIGVFTPRREQQGYPGRLHGGVASAILDEVIGRTVNISDPNAWGVTVELTIRYKKPIPIGTEVRAVGRMTKDSNRIFEGTGEIVLKDGSVAVQASGKYLRMQIGEIVEGDLHDEWMVDPRPVPNEI